MAGGSPPYKRVIKILAIRGSANDHMSYKLFKDEAMENTVIRKLYRRFMWYLVLLFFCTVMDRVNIGFAALQMNRDLGISHVIFGLAASAFSAGYLLFDIPSNLLMQKFGARRWIGRIMITWGIVTIMMCLVVGPNSLLGLRFILGCAEAGFLPGILLYLGYWFPNEHRARANAVLLVAMPISQTVAALIASLIFRLDGINGIAGWKWFFLVEGLATVIVGCSALMYLTDRPEKANWLTPEERNWLTQHLQREAAHHQKVGEVSIWRVFLNRKLLALAAVYFFLDIPLTAIPIWLPQIIRGFGISITAAGILTAIPPLLGACIMILWSRRSDKKRERAWHLAAALFACATGWALTALGYDSMPLVVLGVIIANGSILAALSIFWTIPSLLLQGTAAAVGIGMLSAVGNFGSMIAPAVIGYARDLTGSFLGAFVGLACLSAISGGLVLILLRNAERTASSIDLGKVAGG